MMTAMTTQETIHGNPGERRILPIGTLVYVCPADNQPRDAPTKYWVTPANPNDVTPAVMDWANGPGIGLGQSELRDFRENPEHTLRDALATILAECDDLAITEAVRSIQDALKT